MAKTKRGPMLCGGRDENHYTSADCWLLQKNRWTQVNSMQEKRFYAAAAYLNENLVVTGKALFNKFKIYFDFLFLGGHNGKDRLKSTEMLSKDGTWVRSDDLPMKMSGHCLVALNKTHIFLTGGYNGSSYLASSFIYSKETGWQKMPDMKKARFGHACAVVGGQHVLVTGGYNDNYLKSTELFDLTGRRWTEGASLPRATSGGKLIETQSGTIFHIGGELTESKIYRLKSDGESWEESENSLSKGKSHFIAVPVELLNCQFV